MKMKKKIIKYIAKIFKIDIYFEGPHTHKVVQTELLPLKFLNVVEITYQDDYHQYLKHIKEESEIAIFKDLVGKGLIKHRIVEDYWHNKRIESLLTIYTTKCECVKPKYNYPEMEWCDNCNGNGKIN